MPLIMLFQHCTLCSDMTLHLLYLLLDWFQWCWDEGRRSREHLRPVYSDLGLGLITQVSKSRSHLTNKQSRTWQRQSHQTYWLGGRKGIRPVKTWEVVGMGSPLVLGGVVSTGTVGAFCLRVVYTMDVLSPFISCPLSFWLTLPRGVLSMYWCCPSRPCVVFLAACTWHCCLRYLFLQATLLFPHVVTIVC